MTQLAGLLRRNDQLIRDHQPKSLVNRSGYHLLDVLGEDYLDLDKMLVGSEGTLALITEATVAEGSAAELRERTSTSTLEQAFLALTGTSIREEQASNLDQMRTMAKLWSGRR